MKSCMDDNSASVFFSLFLCRSNQIAQPLSARKRDRRRIYSLMAAAFLPFLTPTSPFSSRRRCVCCTSSTFGLLFNRRSSICSLASPISSSKWKPDTPPPRRRSPEVACASSSAPKNTARPSSQLFVSGLSFRTTEEGLRNAFQNFGELMEVNLVMDRIANRPRGFAFLRYATEEESRMAIEGMHGKFLDGRVIFVEVAKPKSELRRNSKPASLPFY